MFPLFLCIPRVAAWKVKQNKGQMKIRGKTKRQLYQTITLHEKEIGQVGIRW